MNRRYQAWCVAITTFIDRVIGRVCDELAVLLEDSEVIQRLVNKEALVITG